MQIYCSVTDWNLALAKALSEGDGNTIMELQDITRGWMQTGEETEAQEVLLTGALDALGW